MTKTIKQKENIRFKEVLAQSLDKLLPDTPSNLSDRLLLAGILTDVTTKRGEIVKEIFESIDVKIDSAGGYTLMIPKEKRDGLNQLFVKMNSLSFRAGMVIGRNKTVK